MVYDMLLYAKLSFNLLGEALLAICQIFNKTPLEKKK